MKNEKIIVFNMAILTGDIDVCKKSIRDGLSLESMTGEVKKSPLAEVQLLLDFAAERRCDGFSNEEIYRLVVDCSPDGLSKYEVVGVAGMKQVLKEQDQRVERFRWRPF